MYKLTKEGEEYLRKGLPEKNLLVAIKSGVHLLKPKKSLKELQTLENFAIALNWAKKNNWVEIKGQTIELTEEGERVLKKKTKIELALESVENTGTADEESLKILLKRKLAEKVKEKRVIKIKEIAQLTPELIISGKWREIPFKKYDVNAPAPVIYPGKKQPYIQFIEEIKEKLIGMGFVEAKSPIVELEFWNFDILFQAQDHPAREVHDTFNLKNPKKGKIEDENLVEKVKKTHETGWITKSTGWKYKWNLDKALSLVLKTQTTATSARFLYSLSQQGKQNEPVKMFCIDRVFRPDVLDRTHLIEFDQCEGIIMAEKLNFKHLLGILKEFAENIVGCKKIRFIPSYYPFTEPSVDLMVYFPNLRKWVEIAGAGLFRPEMLAPLKIKNPILAWGIGLTRLAMLKLGLNDIRYLFAEDLEWLRNKELVR